MQTASLLYASGRLLTTPLVGDPSVTLIENGPLFFGVLLARACTQPAWGNALFLEEVIWFRASRQDFKTSSHRRVCLSKKENVFCASDVDQLKAFPIPSTLPYATLFLEDQTLEHLERVLSEGRGSSLFSFAQANFGRLPGFQAQGQTLVTPLGYAELETTLPLLA